MDITFGAGRFRRTVAVRSLSSTAAFGTLEMPERGMPFVEVSTFFGESTWVVPPSVSFLPNGESTGFAASGFSFLSGIA